MKESSDSSAFFDSTSPEIGAREFPPVLIGGSHDGACELYRIEKDGKFRVLKCLKPQFRGKDAYEALLRKEYEIGYSLSCPYICEVYAYVWHPELGNCIEIEWIDGVSLDKYLDSEAINETRKERIAGQLLEAVAYFHSKQVIHKDLKPSNILITHNGGNVKIIDFGFADTDGHSILKLSAGTLEYAAPELIAGEDGAPVPEDKRPLSDDVCTIIFTSGTTGKSKGVMLTQRNLYDDVTNVIVTFEPGTTMLSVLPVHHAYCLVMDWLKGFSLGATLYINDSLLHMVRNIGMVKPQVLLMVPLMIETIGKRLAAIESDLPKPEIAKQLMGENLEYIFSGGAHLDPAYISLFEEYGIKVCEGYGMSECSPTISSNGQTGNRPGSVGKVLANMQVRFVDGEIQVKGSNVMKGYYKMPKETEEAFVDGWLRTGDLGCMDEDGYLYITGRLKNLIILSNGENVSPEEIENTMLTNDLVGEIIISGEENGLAARIYPDPDVVEAKGLSPEEVQAQLQAILDDYNKTQPLYRAITALTVRKYPFVKNATKKIVRAKMDVDEAPEEG